MFSPLPVPERFAAGFPYGMAVRLSQIRAEAQDGAGMAAGVAATREHYRELGMPVAIVAGTKDRVVDMGRPAARLQGKIPGSELQLVPGAGHMVHYAMPGLVAELVGAVSARSAGTPRPTRFAAAVD